MTTTKKPSLCDECLLRTDGWMLVKEKDLLTEEEIENIIYNHGDGDVASWAKEKLKALTKKGAKG